MCYKKTRPYYCNLPVAISPFSIDHVDHCFIQIVRKAQNVQLMIEHWNWRSTRRWSQSSSPSSYSITLYTILHLKWPDTLFLNPNDISSFPPPPSLHSVATPFLFPANETKLLDCWFSFNSQHPYFETQNECLKKFKSNHISTLELWTMKHNKTSQSW